MVCESLDVATLTEGIPDIAETIIHPWNPGNFLPVHTQPCHVVRNKCVRDTNISTATLPRAVKYTTLGQKQDHGSKLEIHFIVQIFLLIAPNHDYFVRVHDTSVLIGVMITMTFPTAHVAVIVVHLRLAILARLT